MGCGQSKIGIYQRKSKNKKNGSKRSAGSGENEDETEDGEDTINLDAKDSGGNEKGQDDSDSVTSKIKQMAQQQTGGAVLAQSDISSSQVDFFKMLDEKIENGPDYEESDEEEQKARMANLLQEWKAACQARHQRKSEGGEQDRWSSPDRGGKVYQDDYETYGSRRMNVMATQKFPTGYSSCPPNTTINMHLQNSFRMNAPGYADQPRLQPRIPIMGNYHPYQQPSEPYNHCETGHPLSSNEPINPLRQNYPQVMLRQSTITSQLQYYPENQRLYPESIRQYGDYPRTYQDQRSYQTSRTMQTVNVLHEHRMYGGDMATRSHQIYQEDPRQSDGQRMMMELPRQQYADSQRSENVGRPPYAAIENQRIYHDRMMEKQRQYFDGGRPMDGPRVPAPYQRPALLTQRSVPEPPRVYRDVEADDGGFHRPDRFSDGAQDTTTCRIYNPSHLKGGRSVSVEVQFVPGPPPPRERIPLQGAPGPPQGSPRPLVARGLHANMHRLPANSIVHYRKPQGAFT